MEIFSLNRWTALSCSTVLATPRKQARGRQFLSTTHPQTYPSPERGGRDRALQNRGSRFYNNSASAWVTLAASQHGKTTGRGSQGDGKVCVRPKKQKTLFGENTVVRRSPCGKWILRMNYVQQLAGTESSIFASRPSKGFPCTSRSHLP